MATMKLTNGATITLTIEELQSLMNPAQAEAPKAEAPKAEAPKAEAPKAEAPKAGKLTSKLDKPKPSKRGHDAVLDSKRVERMAQTAADKAKAQGFNCKTSKQGAWIWLYPVDGKGRTPEFKALKLAKGWKYSPKRGAFYRDFTEN